MNKMIVANLVHRPIRSLISIVAIALEVTLILLIVGLSVGMLNDARQRQAGIGADVIVQPPNTSFMAGVSNAPMSIKIGGVLAQLPHVKTVSPVIWQLTTTKNLEVIYGIDLKTFEARHAGALQAYLRQAIANRIRDEIRKVQSRPVTEDAGSHLVDGAPTPLEQAIGSERLERYESALKNLQPGEREAIVARLELQQSYEEVAIALGKPSAGAARMAVMRAVRSLVKAMDET